MVLSASVLRAARTGYGEGRADLAARAGIGLHVVEGAEDGTLLPVICRTTRSWRSATRFRS